MAAFLLAFCFKKNQSPFLFVWNSRNGALWSSQFGALSQVLGMDPNVLMQICQNSVRQPAPIAAAPVVQVVEEAVQENNDEDDYYSSEEEPAVNVFGPIRLAEFAVK
uniref:Uncharacterized protein n=1 Tax=Ditylenchus dipsaci TaxID=166011 RepID=A0A915EH77_9BILA